MIISYPTGTGAYQSRIIESGDGPREIWLVHGIGGRADRWRSCLEPLARSGYRVRAVDLPGHGFAARTDGFDYTVAGFSAFLCDILLRHTEGSSVTLVGTSFGAQLALRTALDLHANLDAPQLAALVLCAPTGVSPLGSTLRDRLAERLPQIGREAVRARLSFMTGLRGADLEAMVEEEYRIVTFPGTPRAFARVAAMIRAELDARPLAASLATLTQTLPVLQIWGEDDRSIPLEIGERISRGAPRMSSVVLPGVGHMPYLQQPEVFCAEILRFLDDSLVRA
ncbi:alpha/beta hydrolase [Nonomuraea longicatena]|uniref:Alpha/beta fold hydrolase n=1 Tax=Nonomuraea longicatena TaxID=83682 RepID=A0ABP4BMG9_9ACTN